jgi:redox-sensing transcriptional repressor
VKKFTTMKQLSDPAIIRLCSLYQLLTDLEAGGVAEVSSSDLGNRLDEAPHNLRKDISFLGEIGNTGAGYEVSRLKEHIGNALGFGEERLVCVVGLGNVGSSLVQNERFTKGEFRIIAGFDSNINKVETLKTPIQLYPAYQMTEIVRQLNITIAIIAVPPSNAQEVTDSLVDGGVRGIVNFSQVVIKPKRPDVFIRNVDIVGEFRIVSALMRVNEREKA